MATLTVTLQESVILNGCDYGSINSASVADVGDVYKRNVTCVHSTTTALASFASNPEAGDSVVPYLDTENIAYIRVTNLDSSNAIELAVVGTTTLYQVTLAAGHSHILSDCDDVMLAEADTSPSFGTMLDLSNIQARPTTSNNVDVEIFIAIK